MLHPNYFMLTFVHLVKFTMQIYFISVTLTFDLIQLFILLGIDYMRLHNFLCFFNSHDQSMFSI